MRVAVPSSAVMVIEGEGAIVIRDIAASAIR